MNIEAAFSDNSSVGNFNLGSQRGYNETQAAKYIGMSVSFLRKDRMNGIFKDRTPGPRWGKVGKRVIYLKDDLDAWLDRSLVPRK